MTESKSTTAVIIETVIATLMTIILAAGVILTVALTSPSVGYRFYGALGNDNGIYLYARKIAAQTDRQKENESDPKTYNRTVRLPAYNKAVESGLKIAANGGQARGLAELFETMFADGDYDAFCGATDLAAIKQTAKKQHTYVTGYDGYLYGKYVEQVYLSDREKAFEVAHNRFADWISALSVTDLSELVTEGSMVSYLSCAKAAGDAAHREEILQSADTLSEAAGRASALLSKIRAATEKQYLAAMGISRSVRQAFDMFELTTGQDYRPMKLLWQSEFDRIQRAYTAGV